jgi:hypothetical protein
MNPRNESQSIDNIFERTKKMSPELNCSQQLFLAKWQCQRLPEAIFASQVLIDLLDDC